MPSYNRVILMGNLTRDPELRHLPSNMAVTSIGLAVNDRWKDKQTGEWKDKANFIDCEAFGRTAEVINEYFRKGRPIMIEGKLRLDQWQDQSGNSRSKLKVVIDSFEFVGGREDGPSGGGGGQRGSSGSRQQPATNAPDNPPHAAIEEDDIPF